MKTQIIVASVLVTLASNVRATIIVHDPYHMAQDAVHEVINIVKWAGTQVKTAETSLNTLRTYENTVLQVARMGNPAALRSLPVVRDIAELYGTGQQAIYQYQQLRSMTDPKNLQYQLGSVVSVYQLQGYNSLGYYQFPSASYAVSQSVQEQMTELEKQRQRLEQKRDALLQSLQSASTASEVAKYHVALDSVNGALSEVSARANELAQRAQLQQQQLNAGAAVQRQQMTERSAATFGSDVNTGMDSINRLAPRDMAVPQWPAGR